MRSSDDMIVFNKDLQLSKLMGNNWRQKQPSREGDDDAATCYIDDGINYWRGRKMIPVEEWVKIVKPSSKINNIKKGIQYFPSSYFDTPEYLKWPEDMTREDKDQWLQDWYALLEYIKDEDYRKHFHPTQEEMDNNPQAKF